MDDSLYDVLGVEATATEEQIVNAYRKACMRTHPDVGGDRNKFMRTQKAYEVLSAPERRRLYDETGDTETIENSLDRKVCNAICSMVPEAFVQSGTDPIKWMCRQVDKQRGIHQQALKSEKSKAEDWNEKIDKFRQCNEDSQNAEMREVILAAMSHNADQHQRKAEYLESQVELGSAIMEALNGLNMPVEMKYDLRAAWPTTTSATSTWAVG